MIRHRRREAGGSGRIIDVSCYVIVDVADAVARRHAPLDLLRAALCGGATVVQLRAKEIRARAFTTLLREALPLARAVGVPLLVNDRVDVAFAAGADGVHVGQEDLSPVDARAMLGERALIGLSVTTPAEAGGVDADVVDYAGVGPVFTTVSKPDAAPAMGLEGLRESRARLALPIVAIGGVTIARVRDLVAAGADGVAVLSAISSAPHPHEATRRIAQAMHEARLALPTGEG